MNTKLSKLIDGGLIVIVAICFSITTASADSLVYKPVNPNFGGSPFNGSYLLGNASAQRQFEKKRKKPTTSEQFQEAINRALINKISQNISDRMLGEDAAESGSFTVGDASVNFQRNGDQIDIRVLDSTTGQETNISMPATQY